MKLTIMFRRRSVFVALGALAISALGAPPMPVESDSPSPGDQAADQAFADEQSGGGGPAPLQSDLKYLQCGNLTYAGNKSSTCFSDHFLTNVADQTDLRVNKYFCDVRLDSDELFDFPFCVMSGNDNFTLTEKERQQLRKYLLQGGFLLVSPGCSDPKWDESFRTEIKVCFPEYPLAKIPMTHPIFSIVNTIPRLVEENGRDVSLEGLEINGRLALVYSKEGLNDVAHASGCCCCGGDEIDDPEKVNVNIFTYAVLY